MNDIDYMKIAYSQALIALEKDEVPVGACIVLNNEVIGLGHNLKISNKNATNHAEIIAINQACENLNCWSLSNATLYVTLEPCAMCAGAIIQSRISRVVYAAGDPKTGSCGSVINLLAISEFNHRPIVNSGIMDSECSLLLKSFFKSKREKNK